MEPIGRDAELGRIDAARAAVEAGTARFVVIAGEAGIGKTSLVEAAADRARASGWRVLVGACLDIGDGGLPYAPIAEILRTLARTTRPEQLARLVGQGREELARIAPDLDPDGDGGPEPVAADPHSQARQFERVLQLLRRLGEGEPTLVVVEDVQWIDRATRDLLTFLLRNLTDERVLTVLTCRLDGLAAGHPIRAWLGDVGRSPRAQRFDLGGLDRAAVAAQIAALEGHEPAVEVVDRIWRRSDGNPLFVAELAAAVGSETPAAGSRPGTLEEMLGARIRGVADSTLEVLAAIALAARPVEDDLLIRVLDAPPAQVAVALRDGLEHDVLTVALPAGLFRFRHELLREAVEEGVLPGERRRLHERFGEVLAQLGDAPEGPAAAAAELAFHWQAAGRTADAYRASVRAAVEAEAVFAHADAYRHYRRALELEPRLPRDLAPDAAAGAEIRRRAADAADLAGEVRSAAELVREVLAAMDEIANPTETGLLHSRLGYLLWALGDSRSIDEHVLAVQLVPAKPASAARARVLARLAGALLAAGRWRECREHAAEAVAEAVAAGEPTEESLARNIHGSALLALGDANRGIEELRRSRELAEGLASPDTLVIAHHNLALNLLQADRFDEAIAEARAGLDVARRTGLERRFGIDLAALLADALVRAGQWSEARRTMAHARGLDPEGIGTVYLNAVDGRLLTLSGRHADAAAHLGTIDASGLDADVAAEVAAAMAEASILGGRPEDAALPIRAGLSALDGLDDALWTAPLLALGFRAAADVAGRSGSVALPDTTAWATRLDALVARAAGSVGRSTAAWLATAEAERRRFAGPPDPLPWRIAVERWEAVPDSYRAAEARWRWAEAELARKGIRASVGRDLVAGHEVARDLGARPLASSIEALARRARVPLPAATSDETAFPDSEADAGQLLDAGRPLERQPDGPLRSLSSRELEVLGLLVAGLSNGEIATRLFISRKTAGVHVTHILDKLGVANRVEAANVAERAGWRG